MYSSRLYQCWSLKIYTLSASGLGLMVIWNDDSVLPVNGETADVSLSHDVFQRKYMGKWENQSRNHTEGPRLVRGRFE